MAMARMREEEPAKKKKKTTTRSERAPWPSSESGDDEPILQTVYKHPSLLTVHPHLPLHSCSGSGNSFVDITSNQAQPLSNFLLIQPDQRHLQILIEVKVQLEDYRPPPLPNPPNLANEGGRTLLYQQGTRPSAVWTWVTKINTSRLLELC